jgi:zinc transporter ZupT
MGTLKQQIAEDLKKLPLILGKLLGGLTAVLGFAIAIWILSRNPERSGDVILFPLFLGGAGVVIFVLTGRSLSGRSTGPVEKAEGRDKTRMNLLTWALFLLFAGIFLVCSYFLTR